ncbi:MAG: MATE family efflux transporter [Acholeplasmatales bacterium]|nr:MATE family efflux transporter [Acholeplasmatales bacterium]
MEETYKRKLISTKHLLLLTIPIFVELFLQLVVGYSDQFMIKKMTEPTVGDNAVNGITNASVVINMVITSFQVLSAASIILISQYRGARDQKNLNKVYSTAFYFNLITGAIFSLIILFFSRFYLHWINTPDAAYQDALIYSMIAGGTVVFQLLSTTLSSFLKANNNMKSSMVITIIVNLLNIVGNYIFISVFKSTHPIIGVALSSALSRLIGFVLMLIIFIKNIKVKLSFKEFLNSKKMLKKIIQVGGPSGGESVSYQSSQIIIQIVINGIVMAEANKAFGIGIGNIKTYAAIFAMVTYMFTSAVSQAMQVVIGELMGAREMEATKKTVIKTTIMALIVSELIATIFFLTSDFLFGLFDVTDPALLQIGKKIMLIEIALELGRAINIVMVRTLQTSGDVMFPTILAIIFCWAVAVGGSFLFGYPKESGISMGLAGVWLAMAIDECARAVIFMIRFAHGKWQKFNLTA